MNNNMLKLNDDKTEFMVITPRHLKSHVPEVSLLLDGVTVSPTESAVSATWASSLTQKCPWHHM